MFWILLCLVLGARITMSAAINTSMSTTINTINYNDSKVAYQSFGIGQDALVFVHGWTCSSSLWGQQAPLFHQFRSLLIDLPGHGESEAPILEYSREYFARAIKTVFDHAEVKRAVFVGHSMGGPVSTTFLRLFPEQVSAIIYVDSFFNLPENYLSQVERKQLSNKLNDDKFYLTLLATFFTARTTPEMQKQVIEVMTGTAKHVRTNATTTDFLPPPFRWGDVFDIPALHLVTPRFADIDREWLHHLPRLESKEWNDYGHFLFMEDAERFNSEVLGFLEQNKLFLR